MIKLQSLKKFFIDDPIARTKKFTFGCLTFSEYVSRVCICHITIGGFVVQYGLIKKGVLGCCYVVR